MSIYFLDSNALAKYYVAETGSGWVRRVVNSDSNLCLVTMIALPEIAAALSRMQRTGRFGKIFVRRAFARFSSDLRQQLFRYHPLDEQTLRFGADLALKHPLKGYDAVQLASALLAQVNLDRQHQVVFVSSDKQVLRAARDEELVTENPEDHAAEDGLQP